MCMLKSIASKLTKATRLATDSKERLQRLTIQSSARHCLAMVGHEVDHKIVSTSRDDRRDRPRKVVRVVENGPPRVVVAVGGSLSLSVRLCHFIESLEPVGFEGVHVPAVEVSISLS